MRGQGSLYVEDVRESDIGTYICRATNDEDSVDTVATLIVEGKPFYPPFRLSKLIIQDDQTNI